MQVKLKEKFTKKLKLIIIICSPDGTSAVEISVVEVPADTFSSAVLKFKHN